MKPPSRPSTHPTCTALIDLPLTAFRTPFLPTPPRLLAPGHFPPDPPQTQMVAGRVWAGDSLPAKVLLRPAGCHGVHAATEIITMNPDIDRATFRAHLSLSRQLLEDGDPAAADAEAARGERVAERWADLGRIIDLLKPLLDDTEPESMRFAAASYLFQHGYGEDAVPILESIRDDDGLNAAAARAMVDEWRRDRAD